MPKTNAELQSDFRRRSELVRLDIRIEGSAKRALSRLAAHSLETQSSTLSDLILGAEREVLAKLTADEQKVFSAGKPITG